MKKILLVILLGVTLFICLISGIAAPVMALTYHDIYKDYRDYEVANFDNIPIVLNKETFGNSVYGYSTLGFRLDFSSCPASTKNITLRTLIYDTNGSQIYLLNKTIIVNCALTGSFNTYESSFILPEAAQTAIKDAITEDDSYKVDILTNYIDSSDHTLWNGVTITIKELSATNVLFYEFNTTYYFDYLALDVKNDYFNSTNMTIDNSTANGANANTYLLVAYDSTDYYRVYNSDYTSSITRYRKKYNIPLGQKITAYGIGVGTYATAPFNSGTYTINSTSSYSSFNSRFYLLNYSSSQQAFPGATTTPDWTYDTCAAWDIPCHLGNALVYLATEAPITSSIYSVVSNAWEVIANGLYAFSSIFGAEFDDNGNLISGNIIGILIVVSLGILIITWGVNSDD